MSNVLDHLSQMQIQGKYVFEQRTSQMPDAHDSTPSGRINGAILAVSSVKDAIPILHGSNGCGFHYRFLCRRQNAPAYHLQCTNLSELELIFGSEDKLKQTILNAYNQFHPPLIAIIPTVPAEIINTDIEGVIRELQPLPGCKLIKIDTSGISHADKRHIGRNFISREHPFVNGKMNGHDIKMKGCGFSDAMTSMVLQIMEPQKVLARSLNLSGIAWGITSDIYSDGIARELIELGCSINTRLPACTLEELETAPRAELNLLTYRVGWAAAMKKQFGTPYFAADYRVYGSRGIKGILDFYLEIAALLKLPDDAINLLHAKADHTKAILSGATKELAVKRSVLCCDHYRDLKNTLAFYVDTMQFNISCILLQVTADGYLSMMKEEDRRNDAENEINRILTEQNLHPVYYINPDAMTVNRILADADYILGSDCYQDSTGHALYLEKPSVLPLNFYDFQNTILEYIHKLQKLQMNAGNQSKLLSYKLQKNMNLLTETNHNASKKMWETMWLQRECREVV